MIFTTRRGISMKVSLQMSCNNIHQQNLGLSPQYQERLRKLWDERVADPFMGIPEKFRTTEEEALKASNGLGSFSANHLKAEFLSSRALAKIRRHKHRKIVAFGYGQGPDAKWFAEAVAAGYEVWWVDVSTLSCSLAMRDLEEQWRGVSFYAPRPVIQRGEIRSVLADPAAIGLDLDDVEIYYLCRTAGCLSKTGAKISFQLMGQSLSPDRDPYKNHKIVIAVTKGGSKTSTTLSRHMILCNVARGANRATRVSRETEYRFFDRDYVAMTIMAK